MILATKSVSIQILKRIYKNPNKVKQYTKSLVPKNCIQSIYDNQLYYVCLVMRENILDYKPVRATIKEIMKDIKITGDISSIITLEQISSFTNNK